jgi:SulP family sulfate permease
MQWLAPVYYANAASFRAEVHKALSQAPAPARALVLDADAISDIDYTGTRALHALFAELTRAGVVVGVARAVGGAPEDLARSGLTHTIGRDHLFTTVDDAVNALHPAAGP